jgi:hypothetical protein
MAFEKISAESRDAADEVLPNVGRKPAAIVGAPLLGQLALLGQQAEGQAD